LAKSKSITIERNLKHEVSYEGDEVFLRQLFLIFLDNAIKYSPPHTSIGVGLERVDHSIRVHFSDQGIGVPQHHLPHIFERFYRAAASDSGETRSGGLGLAIAQAIVRAQGGSIECKTSPGEGSVFTIVLPQREWQGD
jgi:signal transduction histidine kinase